jgi:hypothetical protein
MLNTDQIVQAHYARHLLNSLNIVNKPVAIQKLESLLTQDQVSIAASYAQDTADEIAANLDKETADPTDNSGSFGAIYLSTLYKALDHHVSDEYINFLEAHFSQDIQDDLKQKAKDSCHESLSLILERLKKAWG